MTDTEILDYLLKSIELTARAPRDVEIGSVVFTLTSKKPANVRELLIAGIKADAPRREKQIAARVALELTDRSTKSHRHI